jgi:hypothetical protein
MSSNPMIVSFRALPGGIIPPPDDSSNSAPTTPLTRGAHRRAVPEPQANPARRIMSASMSTMSSSVSAAAPCIALVLKPSSNSRCRAVAQAPRNVGYRIERRGGSGSGRQDFARAGANRISVAFWLTQEFGIGSCAATRYDQKTQYPAFVLSCERPLTSDFHRLPLPISRRTHRQH